MAENWTPFINPSNSGALNPSSLPALYALLVSVLAMLFSLPDVNVGNIDSRPKVIF